MKITEIFLLAAFLAFAPPNTAAAQSIDPELSAKNKINVAGRQRMLSQKIAKSLCFAALGVARNQHLQEAADAIALFERSAQALRMGSLELNMLPEHNPHILAALDVVDAEWQAYGVALKPNVASGQIDDETLDLLFHNSLSVLRVAHAAVGVIEAEFGKSSIKPAFATGINIAGRQRMLTQRAAKEYCFVVSGVQPAHNDEALHGTMGLFEDSLFGLTFGSTDLGLIEPEITLEWQFLELLNLWYYMQDQLEDGLAHARDLSPDAMAQIGEISNLLLVESNRAVSMYVDWALRYEEDQTASSDQQDALY